ncbi:MAG: DUF3341 domain-containing protein [Deltaproteobacteria bacterium]|nr:DUF3341 domain-containing protein [Deltaproteobacteria bacterium]
MLKFIRNILARFDKTSGPGVLAVFYYVDAAAEAIQGLKQQGYKDLTVFSAVPHHSIEEILDHRASPVRYFTLFGGILGCLSGYAFTVWTSLDWELPLAGKPVVSIPPYTVIMFELTILFGALFTLLGLVLTARLPHLGSHRVYDPRFSGDRVGVFVRCEKGKSVRLEEFLKQVGAEEVRFEGGV